MKVLLIGSGGREHALGWSLVKNPDVRLVSAPGSSALAKLGEVRNIAVDDLVGLVNLAKEIKPDLTVIGPETPLVLGLADVLRAEGFLVYGPGKQAARIEGSKVFSKDFMVRHNLPTSSYAVFYEAKDAVAYLEQISFPVVLKADGLAAGKGVMVCGNIETAIKAVEKLSAMDCGQCLVVEEFLAGEEISYMCITDGKTILPLAVAQDHKTIFDGDRGPNTGGMGAYSPAPLVNDHLDKLIVETILKPAVEGLAAEGIPFCGTLYAGLMITMGGPKLLEFNARFGDPETQVILPRLKTDLYTVFLAAATGKLDSIGQLSWDSRTAVCVVMSAEGYPGEYRKGDNIEGMEKAKIRDGVVLFESGITKKTDSNGLEVSVTSGGRVLGVCALAEGLPNAVKNVYDAVGDINFKGSHYRRDIAGKAMIRSGLYALVDD